jgi:glycosyltransferase involved in cell wall biosynthesis
MALAFKTRRNPLEGVDKATMPIDHNLFQGYRHYRGPHNRIIVETGYGKPDFERVMLPPDRPRTREMVQDYLALDDKPRSSLLDALMFFMGLWGFWTWLRPLGRLFYSINATDRGGGVVMMNVDLQAHCDAYGVPMQWYAMLPDPVAFLVTKRCFHNPLHGIKSPPPVREYPSYVRGLLIAVLWLCPLIGRFGKFPAVFEAVAATKGHLTSTDKLIYRRWTARCFWHSMWAMAAATDVSLEDWQPARYARYMRGWGVRGILFRILRLIRGRSMDYNLFMRDHIDTQRERLAVVGSPASIAWLYSWHRNKIMWADRFIVHDAKFVPEEVLQDRPEMAVIMRATSSLTDDHNRPMTRDEEFQVMDILNEYLEMSGLEPLSFEMAASLVASISRFCPPKRKDLALKVVVRANQILHSEHGIPWAKTLQYIDLGFGSIDDRDGTQVYEEVREILAKLPEEQRRQLRVLRTGHLDLLKNLVLKLMLVGIHLAEAEGSENGIADAGFHWKPYIVRPEGGPSNQIKDGESGLVLEYNEEIWARALVELFTNQEMRDHFTAGAKYWSEHLLRDEFTTACNMQNFLWLCRNPTVAGNSQLVRDLVKSDYSFAA